MQCPCPQCLSPLVLNSIEARQTYYQTNYQDDLEDFIDNDETASNYYNSYKNLIVNVPIEPTNENNMTSNFIENYYQPGQDNLENAPQTFQPIQKKQKFTSEFKLLRYRPIKFNDKSLSLFQPR
jgi:hypothetical protein